MALLTLAKLQLLMKIVLFTFLATLSFQYDALALAETLPQLTPTPTLFSFLHGQVETLKEFVHLEIPKQMLKLQTTPSPLVFLSCLLGAFTYGVFHTLGPGHGKTVVATYLLTHGGNFWKSALMGGQVAMSHVSGAIFLVLIADVTMHQIFDDTDVQIFWMHCFSHTLITGIGLFMFIQAVSAIFGKVQAHTCCSCTHHKTKKANSTFLSIGVGVAPCTGSLLILLYAMAHHVLWLGLIMVICVAIGMAIAITAIGWICVLTKKNFLDNQLTQPGSGAALSVTLQLVGSLIIMAFGGLMLLTTLT